MNESKSLFRKIYEILSDPNRLEDIEFANPWEYEHIQLPPEATYRKEMQQNYYDDGDRYGFLFGKENKYKSLYYFLQSGKEFREFQLKEIKLYMGLFAYADYDASANLGLRYLYGPMDLDIDKGKPCPNFYLKSFYHDGSQFHEEQSEHFGNSIESFYYSRSKISLEKIDFIRILQGEVAFQHKRTLYEKENNFIYAPSGEMDACILMLVILLLEPAQRSGIEAKLKEYEHSKNDQLPVNDDNRFRLDFRLLKPSNVVKQDYIIPYENREYTFWQWLRLLGLIEINGNDWQLKERGIRLLKWFEVYCKSILGLEPEYINYHGILEKLDMDLKTSNPDIIHDYWLKGLKSSCLQDIHEVCKDNTWTAVSAKYLFVKVLRLMFKWREPGSDSKVDQITNFQKRCRFNLFSHFVLRSGERGENIESSSRAWIVFPILSENVDVAESDKKKYYNNVGFFLGTFKDSNDDGNGYFENLPTLRNELDDIIFKTKVIIGKLAEVENREIYYDGIFEARLTKGLFFKLHHSQYTYFDVLRVISKQLSKEAQHAFSIAHDCAARYLDIAKHLPNRLDEYLRGYTVERLSITQIISEVVDIINILFTDADTSIRIFKINRQFIGLFQERARSGTLISIDPKAGEQFIRVNKGIFILILKELFINALRNTYRGDPHVFVSTCSESGNLLVSISNHYKQSSNIEKTATETFGQDIIAELIRGLNWKYEISIASEMYSYKVSIPLPNKAYE